MQNSYDILIIDDEQVVIDSIKLVAKSLGYSTIMLPMLLWLSIAY
jgi:CheY-like chemotaxis protein